MTPSSELIFAEINYNNARTLRLSGISLVLVLLFSVFTAVVVGGGVKALIVG